MKTYQDGIIDFEQSCERIIESLHLPDKVAMFIQTEILDKAQIECESKAEIPID